MSHTAHTHLVSNASESFRTMELPQIVDGKPCAENLMMLVCGFIRGKREGLGVRHASQGCGRCASDAAESSMASATRARRENFGRQEARRRIFSQSCCVAQFNTAHKMASRTGTLRGLTFSASQD